MHTETQNPAVDFPPKHRSCSKSLFSPTVKGTLIGAVSGSYSLYLALSVAL